MSNRFNITDLSINSLRSRNMTEERIYIQDTDKQGIFEYDPIDIITADDGVYVIVDASGRRYKKVTASLVGLKIPAAELPSYLDDVLEYANLAAFPVTGISGIIYIAADTGLSYRWTGSIYAIVAGGVASVNGKSGIVNLYTDDISEDGTPINLWYTEARVSANTDVAANTSARHAALTIHAGSTSFASLSGQQLIISQIGINYWVKSTNDIYYSAGKVSIGTSAMAGALNIIGNVGTDVGSNNFAWGGTSGALNSLSNNSNNIGIGSYAGRYITTASGNSGYNINLGFEAGYGQSGLSTYTNVIAIGYRAGYSLTTGSGNFFAGNSAGYSATNSTDNIFIGNQAGYYSTGSSNVVIGNGAGIGNSGVSTYTHSNLFGYRAGYVLTTGSYVNVMGQQALTSNTTGSYINAFGYKAGFYSIPTGSAHNNLFGYQAGYGQNGLSTYTNVNIFGADAGRNLTTASFINAMGNSAAYNTTSSSGINAFGFFALYSNQTGSFINAIGHEVGYYNIPAGNGYSNLFGYQAGYGQSGLSTYTDLNAFGYRAGYSLTTGVHNNFIGNSAGYSNTTGSYINAFGNGAGFYNVAVGNAHNNLLGYRAGYGQSGLSTYTNVNAMGTLSGYSLTTGYNNNFFGPSAGYSTTSGISNNAFGDQALYFNTGGAYINAMGYRVGYYHTPSFASYSNLFGFEAGYGQNGLSTYTNLNAFGYRAGYSLTTGSHNNFIGNNAGYSLTIGSHNNFIGNNAGYSYTSSQYNTSIGYNSSRYNNPVGDGYNINLGFESGHGQNGLSTYTETITIGKHSGYSLTTGVRNTFIGNRTGYLATTIDYAINIGYQAGYSNSTGDEGICIGKNAGYYETNGARLYITNQQGSNLADGITKAIIYGEMNATTSSQILYLNAGTSIFANALGVTQSTTRGLILENSTAAAAGAQQYSPAIRWRGFGWKTDATASSQAVDFRSFVVPVQGAAAPTGSLRFEAAINAGSYSEVFSIDSLGFSKDGGRKRVGTQFDKTTNTTLGDVTNLSVTVGAGDTYKFKAHLFVNADATGGSKYAIGGTATATNIIYSIRLLDEGTDAYTIVSRQTALGGNAGQAGTTAGNCIIEGSIVVNAGGTLTVQFAQNASNGTSSVLVGSTFEIEKI